MTDQNKRPAGGSDRKPTRGPTRDSRPLPSRGPARHGSAPDPTVAVPGVVPKADSKRADLHQHQSELEAQNDELRWTMAELDASRARYYDFYNFAPVGYVTVSELGLILEANLTLGLLLGVPHGSLVGQSIYRHLYHKEDQDSFQHLGQQLAASGEAQYCELRLIAQTTKFIWASLKATVAQDEGVPVWRFVVSDISERKQKDLELRQATERFELAVAGSTDGQWDWDFTTNSLFFSPRFKQLLGFAADDPRFPNAYASFKSRLHPEDLRATEAAIEQAVLAGGPYRSVFRLQTEAGNWRWFEARGATLRNAQDCATRLSGSISDITERKAAEKSLAHERFLLRALLNHVPDFVYFKDRVSHFIRVSQSMADVHGLSDAAQMIGLSDSDYFPAEQARQALSDEQTIIRTGEPLTKEERLTWPDRADTWVSTTKVPLRDEAGAIIGTFGISRDVTERKHAEQKLRLSDLVLKSVSKGVLITGPDRRIISANQAFSAITGYSEKEVLGRDCRLLQGAQSNQATVEAIRVALQNGTEYAGEILNYRKDGTTFWNDLSVSCLRDEQGRLTHFIGIIRDITERKQTEQALLQAKTEAESANRAKSQFLATMSHELRTPMNGVIGFTELLLDTPLEKQQRRFVELLKVSSHNLLSLINDILDFSSIESGKFTLQTMECDAVQLISEESANFEPQARSHGLDWSLAIAPEVPRLVAADPVRFRKVLGYLLGNALKFTKQGRIRVELAPVTVSGQPHLRISVSDTGVGIPREKQASLFQLFSQADASSTREYGGTGLGLAISRKLVELMGGTIGFESEAGAGSTFWFTMRQPKISPIAPPQHATLQIASAPAEALEVLVVEDNFVNQQLAKFHLLKQGCKVTVASNGARAVDLVHEQRFDLVFMDCMMPEMDGYEATRAIRTWEKQTHVRQPLPIIALTANAMAGDREKCLECGMDDYLAKPIIATQLSQMIEKWRPVATG